MYLINLFGPYKRSMYKLAITSKHGDLKWERAATNKYPEDPNTAIQKQETFKIQTFVV